MRTNVIRSRLVASPLFTRPVSENNLQEALNTIYNPESPQQDRDRAQNWLLAYRTTNEAWAYAVAQLQSQHPVVATFGAHTLQHKIKSQWHTIDGSKQGELLKFLLECLRVYHQGPNMVLVRVCLAICQVVLHTVPHQWNHVIDDLLALIVSQHQLHQIDMRRAVLTLLKLLPEEVEKAPVTEAHRQRVTKSMRGNSEKVAYLLLDCLRPTQPNVNVKIVALECLTSWDFPFSFYLETDVLEYVFEALASVDACVQYCYGFLSHFLVNPHLFKYHNLRKRLLSNFVALEHRLRVSIEKGDDVTVAVLSELLSSLGDSLTDIIVDEEENGPRITQLLCLCAAQPSLQISASTFQFWCELSSSLTQLDVGDMRRCRFAVPFRTVIQILRNQCLFQANDEGFQLQTQIQDSEVIDNGKTRDRAALGEFFSYREDAADVMREIYLYLTQQCIEELEMMFLTDIRGGSACDSATNAPSAPGHMAGPMNNGSSVDWKRVEATLYLFAAITELNMGDDCRSFISKVIGKLREFPSIPQLARTVLSFLGVTSLTSPFLGSASRWISTNQRWLEIALGYIMSIIVLQPLPYAVPPTSASNLLSPLHHHSHYHSHHHSYSHQRHLTTSQDLPHQGAKALLMVAKKGKKVLLSQMQPLMENTMGIATDTAKEYKTRRYIIEALGVIIDQLPYSQSGDLIHQILFPLIDRLLEVLNQKNPNDVKIFLNELNLIACTCAIVGISSNAAEEEEEDGGAFITATTGVTPTITPLRRHQAEVEINQQLSFSGLSPRSPELFDAPFRGSLNRSVHSNGYPHDHGYNHNQGSYGISNVSSHRHPLHQTAPPSEETPIPQSHPLFEPLRRLWERMEDIIVYCNREEELWEIIGRLIRNSVRNLQHHYYAPFLLPTLTLITSSFEQWPNVELLRALVVCIAIFPTHHAHCHWNTLSSSHSHSHSQLHIHTQHEGEEGKGVDDGRPAQLSIGVLNQYYSMMFLRVASTLFDRGERGEREFFQHPRMVSHFYKLCLQLMRFAPDALFPPQETQLHKQILQQQNSVSSFSSPIFPPLFKNPSPLRHNQEVQHSPSEDLDFDLELEDDVHCSNSNSHTHSITSGNSPSTHQFGEPADLASNLYAISINYIRRACGRHALSSIIYFFESFIEFDQTRTRRIVLSHLLELLTILFEEICAATVSVDMIPAYGRVLQSIRNCYPIELRKGLLEVFSHPNLPVPGVPNSWKESVVSDLFSKQKPQEFNLMLINFSTICRGLDVSLESP